MCKLCNRRFCPPNCPNFEDHFENPSPKCVRCGEDADGGRGYYTANGNPYCLECLMEQPAEFFIRICGIPTSEWLKKQGFYFCRREDI